MRWTKIKNIILLQMHHQNTFRNILKIFRIRKNRSLTEQINLFVMRNRGIYHQLHMINSY